MIIKTKRLICLFLALLLISTLCFLVSAYTCGTLESKIDKCIDETLNTTAENLKEEEVIAASVEETEIETVEKIKEPPKQTLEVLATSDVKTYMDYTAITNRTSTQWNMIYEQQLFNINDDGFLITDDGYYAVALGSYFGKLGNKFIFVLDTGNQIPAIKLDEKQNRHTDKNNFAGLDNGDIIEFVVDGSKMPRSSNGFCYGGNFNNIDAFNGNIVEIIEISGNEYYN